MYIVGIIRTQTIIVVSRSCRFTTTFLRPCCERGGFLTLEFERGVVPRDEEDVDPRVDKERTTISEQGKT